MTASPKSPARHDLYSAVHKGLRLAHGRLLARIGSADWTDQADLAALAVEVSGHVALSRSHLNHEDREIHTALEARRPGAIDAAEEEHDHHLEAFGEIERLLAALVDAPSAERLTALYRRFARFVADDILHMDGEETVLLPTLQAAFNDDELRAIEGRIVSSIAPAEMERFMALIMAAVTPTERAEMLAGMRAGMPPEAYRGFLEAMVKPNVPAHHWPAIAMAA